MPSILTTSIFLDLIASSISFDITTCPPIIYTLFAFSEFNISNTSSSRTLPLVNNMGASSFFDSAADVKASA
ncbi:hypothetical protein PL321_18330 [Caloramator sp. mosi_1]|nr:hypothetical protein [Caloramator sp. mosi_1]WDC84180.1 hypothetical protein PL321_18330 [Caloramator sp. mosi_1]